ncbi:CGNR zinc finger domain-containing protein [Nocardioides kongjuensis]|uniref:Putative RNA-binding Zn ribbon-like protein n=1 Tax=Nocardioides kongjuensis TaxID=349522 RepID=A0A852RTE7_9ACTN|nr:CGNR zinc finger domain-containing protein [Nocardioides kongjuensis]NYD32496.1 putative RNA-binding Zn ribbon-like protein [Nocardioides kongjuensis]
MREARCSVGTLQTALALAYPRTDRRRILAGGPAGLTAEDAPALRTAVQDALASLSEVDLTRRANALLAEHDAQVALVRHDMLSWHLHATSRRRGRTSDAISQFALSLLLIVAAGDQDRLTNCADTTCDSIVFDASRNRSRRFCSTACGNRHAVAAFRERRRQE